MTRFFVNTPDPIRQDHVGDIMARGLDPEIALGGPTLDQCEPRGGSEANRGNRAFPMSCVEFPDFRVNPVAHERLAGAVGTHRG
jgi:hypothetical protein